MLHDMAREKCYKAKISCSHCDCIDKMCVLFNKIKRKCIFHLLWDSNQGSPRYKKVQVGKDQEKTQSEIDSHSKNRGGKKPN